MANSDPLQPPTDNLRSRVVSGVAYAGAAQMVKVIVQIVSVVTLSRLLTPEDFGVMAMISPIIAFVMIFQDLGLASAIANSRDLTHTQMSTIFWINICVSAILAVFVASSAPLVGLFYDEEATVGPMMALAASLFIAGLGAQHKALSNRQMLFARGAVVDIASAFLSLVAGIAVALIWPSPWAIVAAVIVGAIASSAGDWWVVKWRPGRLSKLSEVRHLLHFGKGLTGFNLTNFLARNLDNVLIGRFAGPVELGFYDRAYKLLLFPMQQINWPVGRVVIPVLSRLVDEPGRYRSAYARVVQQVVLITVPGVVCLLTNAETAIPTVLGPQWGPTVPIFLWLGIAALYQPMSATTGWLFISQHRTDELAVWGFIVAVTCVAAFVIGLPWGALGVAMAYTLSDLFIRIPIVVWLVGRKGPVSARMLCELAFPHICANGAAAGVMLMLPVDLGLPPVGDLILRLFCAYAVSWSAFALFPSGRRTFGESIRTLVSLRGQRGRAPEQV